MDTQSPFAYISGALTNVPDNKREALKLFYEKLGRMCEKHGLNVYIPHQHSDPVQHPNLTPREVNLIDHECVSSCSLLVAYVGVPSFGVGAEITWANLHQIPIILVVEADQSLQRQVSRLIRGFEYVRQEICFTDDADALRQLATYLDRYKPEH